jgi:hypothetical protein
MEFSKSVQPSSRKTRAAEPLKRGLKILSKIKMEKYFFKILFFKFQNYENMSFCNLFFMLCFLWNLQENLRLAVFDLCHWNNVSCRHSNYTRYHQEHWQVPSSIHTMLDRMRGNLEWFWGTRHVLFHPIHKLFFKLGKFIQIDHVFTKIWISKFRPDRLWINKKVNEIDNFKHKNDKSSWKI